MYETALILSVVVFIAAVVAYASWPSASVFHPATFYLMFHGLVFVARPIFGWIYDYHKVYDAMGFYPSVWEKTQALICTNLALVVFMTVIMILTPNRLHFEQDKYDLEQRPLLFGPWFVIALTLGALAVYSVYWLFDYRGTHNDFIGDLDLRSGYRAMRVTNGYFLAAGSMLPPMVAIIAFLGRFRLWSLLPFIAYALFRFGTGQRGDVVAAAVMIALLFMYDRRRKWPTLSVAVAGLVLATAFTAIGTDRGAGIRRLVGFEAVKGNATYNRQDEKPLENLDLSMLEMVEYSVWLVPNRSGSYDYFLQNLQVFTEPIPRALWPGKPVGPPIRMFNLYTRVRSISGVFSVPGIGWMCWGFMGVAIWSSFFAWVYASGFRLFARSRQSNMAVIAYMVFLSTATVSFRDGTVLTILKQSFSYFVPLALVAMLAIWTRLPSKDRLRQLRTAQAGVPDTPHGRRHILAASELQGPLASTPGQLQPVPAGPRERRRARMADMPIGDGAGLKH